MSAASFPAALAAPPAGAAAAAAAFWAGALSEVMYVRSSAATSLAVLFCTFGMVICADRLRSECG